MLNKKEFARIRNELVKNDNKRELLIADSRDIIRLSKVIIYALQRSDFKKAESLIKKIKSKVKKLPFKEYSTGMKNVALQEYVEAIALHSFLKSGKIPTRAALGVGTESYLSGLADMTGELVRVAVNRAIKKKDEEVLKIKGLVEAIYGEFLQMNLRNSELRKKSDQIKWNLQKLEDMVYNMMKK